MLRIILALSACASLSACSVDAPDLPKGEPKNVPTSPESAPPSAPSTPSAPSAPTATTNDVAPTALPQFAHAPNADLAQSLNAEFSEPTPTPPQLSLFHRLVLEDNVEAITAHLNTAHTHGLEVADRDGRLPLHFARSAKMVSLLWDRPVNVGTIKQGRQFFPQFAPASLVRDAEGMLPIHRMALTGQKEALKFAVQKWCSWFQSDRLNLTDAKGRSLIHLAAINGESEIAKTILNCKWATLNLQDQAGRTALHYAAEHAAFSVGYLLVNTKTFDVLQKDNNGDSAHSLAQRLGFASEVVLAPK